MSSVPPTQGIEESKASTESDPQRDEGVAFASRETEPPRASNVSLKKQSARASMMVGIGFGASQLIRFASNTVLVYLLPLSAFGLTNLVSTLLKGANMFSDAGLSGSVTRSPKGDDPEFLQTAWSLQLIRGVAVAAICAAFAWPYSAFYGEPMLLPLILIAAINPLMKGASSPSMFGLRRHMKVGAINAIEVLAAITSTGSIVAVALIQRALYGEASAYAIVIGSAVGGVFYVGWTYLITRSKPMKLGWDKESLHEQIRFGRWIFLTSALTFLAMQADRLILGKMITLEEIGLYGLAINFVRIGKDVMQRVGQQVIFPAISKRNHLDRAQLRKKIAHATKKMMIVAAIALAVGSTWGDIPIELLYPKKAESVGWMFSILSAGLIIRWVQMMTGPALMAIGDPSWNAYGSVGRLIAVAAGIIVGYDIYGMPGVIISMALADIPNYISVQIGAQKHGLSNVRRDMLVFGVFILAVALSLAIRLGVGLGLPTDGMLPTP